MRFPNYFIYLLLRLIVLIAGRFLALMLIRPVVAARSRIRISVSGSCRMLPTKPLSYSSSVSEITFYKRVVTSVMALFIFNIKLHTLHYEAIDYFH